jgi:hypothetical protein
MVSTPSWHNDFYQNALKEALLGKKHARILISGTADYGMLQQIISLEDSSSISEIIVLDLCRTPLEICSWFRKKYISSAITLNYFQQDIVGNVLGDKSQDIIITDAFLTRFTPDQRKKIVQEWKRMLKDDGFIITTIRIGSNSAAPDRAIKSTEADVRRYSQKAKNRTESAGRLFKNIEAKIINKAKEYAKNIISYPFVDENEIVKLFEGFELTINLGMVSGELQENTTYAKVIAKKTKVSNLP